MKHNTPAKTLQHIGFCTPAGVERVRLKGDKISGRWEGIHGWIYGPTRNRLAEDFANWPNDPDQILRFTKRYGPLRSRRQSGKRFEFSLGEWLSEQISFQHWWEGLSPQFRRYGGLSMFETTLHGWMFFGGQLTYTAASLSEFLYLDLFSYPVDRLRKCLRPGCKNPYFIARHLKQKYCKESCASWAQSIWKKQWWQERGEKWRADRVMRQKKRR